MAEEKALDLGKKQTMETEVPESIRKETLDIGCLDLTYGKIKGIFCLETAAFLNGMCLFGDNILFIYKEKIKDTVKKGNIIYKPTKNGGLNTSECIKRADEVYVTNPLRTIRELIEQERYQEHICECLDWWSAEYGNISLIVADLKKHGLYGKLQKYLDAMDDYEFEYKLK